MSREPREVTNLLSKYDLLTTARRALEVAFTDLQISRKKYEKAQTDLVTAEQEFDKECVVIKDEAR